MSARKTPITDAVWNSLAATHEHRALKLRGASKSLELQLAATTKQRDVLLDALGKIHEKGGFDSWHHLCDVGELIAKTKGVSHES